MWINVLSLLAGGSLGVLGRYGAILWLGKHQWMGMPVSTLTVNLLGSLVIGFLWGWLDVPQLSDAVKNFLFVGFLGGFTTFSSLSLEVMQRFQEGDAKAAILYVVISNLMGVLLAFAGIWFGTTLRQF